MSKWTRLMDAMRAGEVPPPPVARLVGFTMEAYGEGTAVMSLEAGEQHHNPMGTLHGGVICDVADGAMGMAYATLLDDDESFTTLELDAKFLRPVWEGRVVAEARVVKKGRTTGLVECDVKDAEGRLVARVSSTCLTLRGEAAKDR